MWLSWRPYQPEPGADRVVPACEYRRRDVKKRPELKFLHRDTTGLFERPGEGAAIKLGRRRTVLSHWWTEVSK